MLIEYPPLMAGQSAASRVFCGSSAPGVGSDRRRAAASSSQCHPRPRLFDSFALRSSGGPSKQVAPRPSLCCRTANLPRHAFLSERAVPDRAAQSWPSSSPPVGVPVHSWTSEPARIAASSRRGVHMFRLLASRPCRLRRACWIRSPWLVVSLSTARSPRLVLLLHTFPGVTPPLRLVRLLEEPLHGWSID